MNSTRERQGTRDKDHTTQFPAQNPVKTFRPEIDASKHAVVNSFPRKAEEGKSLTERSNQKLLPLNQDLGTMNPQQSLFGRKANRQTRSLMIFDALPKTFVALCVEGACPRLPHQSSSCRLTCEDDAHKMICWCENEEMRCRRVRDGLEEDVLLAWIGEEGKRGESVGGRVNTEKEVTGEGFPTWGRPMGSQNIGKQSPRLHLPYTNPMNLLGECGFEEIINAKDIFCISCSSWDPTMLDADVAERDTV